MNVMKARGNMLVGRSLGGSCLMRRRPFTVIVCLITAWSFLFNTIFFDLSWADRVPPEISPDVSVRPVSSGVIKELNVKTFTLPEYLGHVRSSWSSLNQTTNPRKIGTVPGRSNNRDGDCPIFPAVIHIQDAHCNYAAQHKISEIIEYLHKSYGIGTINMEGGAEDYNLSIFTSIADSKIREKTADYFIKEGLVNGAEYFAINNPGNVSLWGIEDPSLYMDNLNVYRNSIKHKDEIDKSIGSISRILTNLKIKIYSKGLLDLDYKYSQYKAGNIEFT